MGEQCKSGNGVCYVFYRTFLGEASKIWEVSRKSLRSSYEVVTKFCADYYPTRSNNMNNTMMYDMDIPSPQSTNSYLEASE